METFLLRVGPVLAGFAVYGLFEWQWGDPLVFPWPMLISVATYAIIAVRIAWSRNQAPRWEAVWKAVPGCLFLASAGILSLMLEQPALQTVLSLFVAFIAYMSLELFFLHKYDAPHYPVHGLTHLDVGLIPLTNAFLAWGFFGIRTFSKGLAPVWLMVATFILVNALGFASTSHSDASRYQRNLWTAFGAWTGAGIACLLLFLPLSMPVQACLAALLAALPIRLRRYSFLSHPSPIAIWIESGIAAALFLGILLLSRWA